MFEYYDSLSILVIPTDACNMKCKYCYHEAHFNNSPTMSPELLEKLMSISIPNYSKVNFIWHGGEPLLPGRSFYELALDLETRFSNSHSVISNSIQTNLTLIDDEWSKFLIENKFGIGSSHDGTYNDFTRGHSREIMAGRKSILDHGGRCGNIMVVSKLNIDSLIDSYEFFRQNNINYKMNMYIRTDNSRASLEMSLPSEEYSRAMIELFDYWATDENSTIRVDPFEEIITYQLFHRKSSCCHTSCLGKWLAVRHDGLVTNCNRYYPDQYHFGNIMEMSDIRESFESQGFQNMLSSAVKRREKCKTCPIYDYCSGGCNNVAMFENGMDQNGGESCKSLKVLYLHIKDFIDLYKRRGHYTGLNRRLCKMLMKYQQNAYNRET